MTKNKFFVAALAASLLATSAIGETITASARVVALADDPTHPEHVARAWAAAIMDATLAVVPRHVPSSAALAQYLW